MRFNFRFVASVRRCTSSGLWTLTPYSRWDFSINRRNRGWEKIEVGERRLRRDVILFSTIIRRVASRNSKFRRVSAEVRFARNFENWCVKKRWKGVPEFIVGKPFWHSAIARCAKVELYGILKAITRLRSFYLIYFNVLIKYRKNCYYIRICKNNWKEHVFFCKFIAWLMKNMKNDTYKGLQRLLHQ